MPAPENIPVWVYLVVTVVLPVLGWISKDAKQRVESKVQDTMNVRGTQGDLIQGLQRRVSELEQRLDEKDRHYQELITSIGTRHEQHIADMEKHIQRLERELRGRKDSGTPGAE